MNKRAEFLERFTLAGVGSPETLDETVSADDLWEWILENFYALRGDEGE